MYFIKTFITSLIIFSLSLSFKIQAQDNRIGSDIEHKIITSETGDTLQVESGMIQVLESRSRNSERKISIAYYRIRCKRAKQIDPIFILAGGPGSSYLNSLHKAKYFDEVQFLSNFSDVVLFDQRGVGNSVPNLQCEGYTRIPFEKDIDLNTLKEAFATNAVKCRDHWGDQGINLSAYNTDENAADLDDLRQELGYKKIILSGGSYGSHLGLHYIRKFPNKVTRAMFYGIEGPDHTWDVPEYLWNTLKRIATHIETNAVLEYSLPEGGLIQALKEIHERFTKESEVVRLTKGERFLDVKVNKLIVERVSNYKAGRRSDPLAWPDLVMDMYNRDYSFPAKVGAGMHRISAPNAMKMAMDFASGISTARRTQIETGLANSVLGDINLDYTLQLGLWGVDDLGQAYRENIISDIPVLIVHGNWDTSTPIENAYEVLSSLKNGHLIEVETGTHNALYECYRMIDGFGSIVEGFLKGETEKLPNKLTLPEINYPKPIPPVQVNLWEACKSGDAETLKIAINNGADVNALDNRQNKSGRKPLNWAAYYNNIEIIEILLENGADINGKNNTGFTALHHAVEKNNIMAVKKLLELGADKEIKNKRGLTPTDMAHVKSFIEILSLLR